jgi:predicted unusual protein kinase regulating ubiquinone biosynthesis (AarF/ABC1/UbiB family)
LRVAIEDFDLRASNVSQGVATLDRLASSVDGLTRELNGIKADVSLSRSTISTYAKTILETQAWLDLVSENWPELENRLSALPKTSQAMIKKNSNFKKAVTLADNLESRIEQLSEIESSASSATSLSELKSAVNDALKLKAALKGYQEFPTTLKAIDKLIPAHICTKGSLVANLPKTGKCAPGYAKVSTR